uniref:hypothetical protein n=1 Tax=Mycoplasmopsis bovis TaxID=28903 RepID=UPI003D2C1B66
FNPAHNTRRYLKNFPTFSVMSRVEVNEPLETGIIAIDSMIPIGKGQRELILILKTGFSKMEKVQKFY